MKYKHFIACIVLLTIGIFLVASCDTDKKKEEEGSNRITPVIDRIS